MVISRHGIVATSQTLASQAGAQILARGGSAMDAAIAANAALGVVEPKSCGIGGDLFAIYWEAKTGKLTGINASGWAPKGLTIDALKAKGTTAMPQEGIHSVTVPGCVDGWAKLHKKFGKLPLEGSVPAGHLLRRRTAFRSPRSSRSIGASRPRSSTATRTARRLFLRNGMAPAIGEDRSAIRIWPRLCG